MCTTTGQMDDEPDYNKEYIYWLAMPTGFAMFEYRFNKFLSVCGELGYTTIGNETISLYDEFVPYSRNYSYKAHYNCAQTSALLKISFDCRWLDLYFLTGPFFMRVYGGRGVYDDGYSKKVYDFDRIGSGYSLYMTDSFLTYYRNRDYNLGLYGGGGLERKLGPGKIAIDCRFGITLLDMFEFSEPDMRDQMKENGYEPFRSLNCSITLSYMYHLVKK
jgi:hypothetical protein